MKQINTSDRLSDFVPPVILKLLGKDTFLAGGALRSYLSSEKVNDFDLFFTNPERPRKVLDHLLKNKFVKVFHCPNDELISLKKKNIHIQLIMDKYHTSPSKLIETFDFTICMFATDGKTLFTTKEALKHLKQKVIMINRITFPASSIKRFGKYTDYGFFLPQGTLKCFMEQVLSEESSIIDFFRVYVD